MQLSLVGWKENLKNLSEHALLLGVGSKLNFLPCFCHENHYFLYMSDAYFCCLYFIEGTTYVIDCISVRFLMHNCRQEDHTPSPKIS